MAKITDEEILKLVEEFEKLPANKQREKFLGAGAFKEAYDLSSDYVLKKPQSSTKDASNQMISDYMASKEMGRHIPSEQPILISREGKQPIHIQKKLSNEWLGKDMDALRDISREFKEKLKQKHINPMYADVESSNIGFDELRQPKVFDPLYVMYDPTNPRAKASRKASEVALDRISKMAGTKIYRSIAPMLLKGLAAGAGGALSLASEASDAPEAGDVLGQEALERDIASDKTQKGIEKAEVPDEVKLKALELFKKNRLPY